MKKIFSISTLLVLVFGMLSMKGWGQISESFETGLTSSYQTGNVTLASGVWNVTNVLAGTANTHSGTKSAQLQSATGSALITPTLSGGVGTISFYIASSTTTGAYQVNISTDNGVTWTPATGSPFTITTINTVTLRTIVVNNSSVNKIQIYRTGATLYVDDFATTAFASGSTATLSNITQPMGSIIQGTSNIVLSGFTISSTASADFTAVTVTGSGTATSTDITSVRIFRDNNANGIIDGADASVSGAGINYGPSMTFSIAGETGITTARTYLIVANVAAAGTSTIGRTVTASVGSGAFTTSATNNTGSATGNSRIISAPPPANDLCSNAIALTVNASAITGTLAGATPTSGLTYAASKNDVWYSYTPTCSGSTTLTLTFTGSTTTNDLDLDVFTTSCPSSGSATNTSHTSTNSEAITLSVTAGITYYLRVIDYNTTAISFTIAVTSSVVPPTFTSGPTPSSATSNPGTTTNTTFTVVASAGTIQWQYSVNGTSGWANVVNGTPAGFTYTGATTSTLGILTTTASPLGTYYYRAVATASGCPANSNNATFTLAQPPTPTTTSISPASKTAGDAGFTITVNGTNFISGISTVTWNGAPRTTTFVNATQLTAVIPASDIATLGSAVVGVTTTGAAASSNTQTFTINPPTSPTATISGTLIETNLNGATISLTLTNTAFQNASPFVPNYSLNNAPAGVSIASVVFNSSTTATITLAYNGTDFDADVTTFNIIINGSELTTGSNVTSNNLTITAVTETLSVSPTSLAFGNQCINIGSTEKSFTITGTNLKTGNITVAAQTGYAYSTSSGGSYTTTLSLSLSGGSYSQIIYVQFTPTSTTSYNGNIVISGGGAPSVNEAVTGAGINTVPTVTTGAPATAVTSVSATLPGTINATGCSAISEYGFYVSTTNGFANGTGQKFTASNLSGGVFSANVAGLIPNTIYYYKAYGTNAGGTAYGAQQTFTTSGLAAPVATAATGITSTSFNANWSAVPGATSYALDVSTSSTFSQATTYTEPFENSLTLFSQTTGTGTFYSGNSAAGDAPASSPFAAQGTWGYGISNGTVTITSSDITTSTSSSLSFKLASFSVNSGGNGADGSDIVTVSVSPDGGTTWFSTLRVLGNSNARWAFDATGTASTAYDGNAAAVDFIATAGTSTTGYSNISINNLPSSANLRVRITLTNDNANERWIVDNFVLNTSVGSFVPGYENLNVGNVTTYPVTGLTPNITYYYRVRAVSATSTSGNSDTITVVTGNNPATTLYRTLSDGNFSNAAIWEYQVSGSTYTPASNPPASTNSVLVRHAVTLNQDYISGAGTTFILDAASASSLVVGSQYSLTIAGSGDLNNKFVTFQSDATSTARFGPLTGTLANASKVVVERYYHAKRSWRLITAPITEASSPTIYNGWQLGGLTTVTGAPAGSGVFVTGPNPTADNGLDTAVNGYSSMKTYDAVSGALLPVTNTKVPLSPGTYKTTPGNAENIGYFLFVRGDRDTTLVSPYTTATNLTTLRDTGALQTGTQTFTFNVASTGNRFILFPNPYASPVNFASIASANSSIQKKFWAWDPELQGSHSVGGYIYMDDIDNGDGNYSYSPAGYTGPVTQHIQSSQAIYVQAASGPETSATIVVNESDKSAATITGPLFRPLVLSTQQLVANLKYVNDDGSTELADGILAQYSSSFSNAVNDQDGVKFANGGESFAIARDGQLLTIERRNLITAPDTLFFNIANTQQKSYRFEFVPDGFSASGNTALLVDTFLKTRTPVSLTATSTISFNITADVLSQAPNRFMIIFRPAGPLPITFSNANAYRQGSTINVEWNVVNEVNMKQYEIERSSDGSTFTKEGSVTAIHNNGSGTYNWIDVNPASGNNYYRIRSIGLNGAVEYSKILNVTIGSLTPSITIYPNPVINGTVTVHFVNLPKGRYDLKLINNVGQVILTQVVQHKEGNAIEKLHSGALAHGAYQLEVTKPDGSKTNITLLY